MPRTFGFNDTNAGEPKDVKSTNMLEPRTRASQPFESSPSTQNLGQYEKKHPSFGETGGKGRNTGKK